MPIELLTAENLKINEIKFEKAYGGNVLAEIYERPTVGGIILNEMIVNTDAIFDGTPYVITYDRHKNPVKKLWFHKNNKIRAAEFYWPTKQILHNENDEPAIVQFNEDGTLAGECWYKEGNIHRNYKPAVLLYGSDGTVIKENWFLEGKNIMRQYVEWVRDCSAPHWLEWTDEHKIMFHMRFTIGHYYDENEI